MPAEFAYVNPLDTADISLVDLQAKPLREGESSIYIPDGSGVPPDIETNTGVRWIATIGATAMPEWNLWDLVRDPTQCDPFRYYTRTVSYVFVTPNVVETAACEEIPIADLYELKRSDIGAQDRTVRYSTANTSLNANWWIVVTENSRFEIGGIHGNWLQRQIDGLGWPGGINRPWIGIYNAVSLRAKREQVTTAAQWETLYLEITQHDQATGNATDASGNALDTAYADGAGVWQDVADHDPADPAWGYPPTVPLTGPDAANL